MLHAQRYLRGQRLQARALARRASRASWCGARPPPAGRSRLATSSSRPGCAGARRCCMTPASTPHERLELLERERVDVLCMAPTEYRVIAKRRDLRPLPALRGMVAAGEALDPEVLRAWQRGDGPGDPRRLRPDRDRPADRLPPGAPSRPGSMGRAAAGRRVRVVDGELSLDPASAPTFFLGYLGEGTSARRPLADRGPPRGGLATGDRVTRRRRLAVLRGPRRRRDRLRRLPDRPVRGRVRARAHPAVAEAAAVAAPDDERGAVVRAVVVLRDGTAPSPGARPRAAGARQG